MQRRQFIVNSMGAMAYAGVGSSAFAASAIAGQGAAPLSAGAFTALLKHSFNIYDSVRGITVQLVKVKEVGPGQFSISFQGAAEDGMDSGTYEVEHASTGKMPMYLDANKRGRHGVVYRADFNLLA